MIVIFIISLEFIKQTNYITNTQQTKKKERKKEQWRRISMYIPPDSQDPK